MTQEEFEKWINNPHMLGKTSNPAQWGGKKSDVKAWENNPYEHPYTRGAYAMLNRLEKKA